MKALPDPLCQKSKSKYHVENSNNNQTTYSFLSPCVGTEITGDWKGVLKAGETEIGFIFTIQESESGLEGSMAIPARNLRNMKAGKTTFANGELLIDGSNNGWQYKATYNPSNQTFEGHFKEGVNMLPLNLSKGALLPEVKKKRPQEPKLPLPYLAEK